jgi:hypothetical protein
MIGHLYQITNKLTGEFYTGVHKGDAQNGYWGSGVRIKRSIKKYGKQNFKYRIWVVGDLEQMYQLERLAVDMPTINSNPLCLNLCEGGKGRRFVSEDITGENNPFYGKSHTEESKQKISSAKKGKTYDKSVYVKRTEQHSDKYKQSILEARKHKKLKMYKLINSQNEIVELTYCQLKEHGNADAFSLVFRGKLESYKGWRKA